MRKASNIVQLTHLSGRVYLGTQFSPEERRAPPHIRATDVPLASNMASTCYAMRGLMLDPSFAGKTFRGRLPECAKSASALAVQSQETGQIVLNPSRMKLVHTVAFGIDDGDDDYLES